MLHGPYEGVGFGLLRSCNFPGEGLRARPTCRRQGVVAINQRLRHRVDAGQYAEVAG